MSKKRHGEHSRPMKFSYAVVLLSFLTLTSCNTKTLFTPIENHFSAPIAVSVDTTRNRAYVVNSNNNYAYTNASLSILDITTPSAPTLLSNTQNPISIPNFSSNIYLNTTTQQAYIPNRLSDNNSDNIDSLLRINLDESSDLFGAVDSFVAGDNPFGLSCCDASGRLYTVNVGGTLGVYDFSTPTTPLSFSIALSGALQSGASYSGANSEEVVLLGSQAFVTNRAGRIYVINTDEVTDPTKNPIDYLILNAGDARGIATDGTHLFVVDGSVSPGIVRIINPSTLTPITPDSPARTEIDLLASTSIQNNTVNVGKNPNQILIFDNKVYISNQDDDTVTVFNLADIAATPIPTTNISVGDKPFGLTAFTAGTSSYLYVTNLFSNSISIVDITGPTTPTTSVATFAP
ncbi:MAG: hypothetical protein IPJ69_08915 [Deltaproteobacteria bacterium]|nr:MAG: hypothetical protein IPJ69_08915 [Deltaproteobacteria bacterium]